VSLYHPVDRNIGFEKDVKELSEFIISKKSLLVITGAGISTESGIPDYRGPNGSYKHGHKPITYQEFVQNEKHRKRYWARSMTAWPVFSTAQPALPHTSLAKLEDMKFVKEIITQNVDRLHHKAGSKQVLELHGTLHEVICLKCRKKKPRTDFQAELEKINPLWVTQISSTSNIRADGDIDLKLQDPDYSTFNLPSCTCNAEGVSKPNVVLFGENCQPEVTKESFRLVDQADGVLILGSSCSVFSVLRLVMAAKDKGLPITVVNVGETRVDTLDIIKIQQPIGDIMKEALTYIEKR